MSSTGIPKLDKLIRNIQTIPINTFISDSLKEEEDFIEDLIGEQHEEGIDGTGNEIRPKYTTERYTAFKRGLGSKTAPTPDLKVTGRFREGIESKVRKNRVEIFGQDKKTPFLTKRYGNPILDHNEKSKMKIRVSILPKLIVNTKKYVLNG